MNRNVFHGILHADSDDNLIEKIAQWKSLYDLGPLPLFIRFEHVIIKDLPENLINLEDHEISAEAYKHAPTEWQFTAFAYKKSLGDGSFSYYWMGLLPC